jgi:diguanylate cyclase (GGDEF)-like protein/PAS domain S-box-containing protein
MTFIIICVLLILLIVLIWFILPKILHTFNISELITDALLIVNQRGEIKYANSNSETLFGYTKQELQGMTVEELMPERYRKIHVHQRKGFHIHEKSRHMGMGRDLVVLTKKGKEIPTEIALSPYKPLTEHLLFPYAKYKMIVLLHDISVRKEHEKIIHNLAYYDSLTKLPNRTSFYEQVKTDIEIASETNQKLGFLLIDIRELKKVNDILGHFVGDDVIQKTAMILNRFIDTWNDDKCERMKLFNISGNEFLIIINFNDTDTWCVKSVAAELLKIFNIPAKIEGQSLEIQIDINIGISILPIHGINISQLLKTADLALIESKKQGKNCYHLYNDSLRKEFNNFVMYENAIKTLLKDGKFDIVYQPIWSIKKDKFVGAEALFRLKGEQYKDMDIEFLINVAESTGLIIPLGEAILRRVCEETEKYKLLQGDNFVSVNLSLQQIEHYNFYNKFCNVIESTGVKTANIAIEITETTIMNRPLQTVEKILHMRDHGMQIFIDDFGKGYSSLSHLHKLPADKLKIDMSFLEDLEEDNSSFELLRGIIELGHSLELTVCVEGVETEAQFTKLKQLNCDEIQGFYKSKPVLVEELKNIY